MKIIVLGAGVVGTTSAWYLSKAGHEVTVVDRQPGAGLETSFANGGQISASHALPWANPGAPLKLLRWLGKEDAPLLFRLHADWQQIRWGLQFLRECTPGRTRQNIRSLVTLGIYSRDQLRALRAETNIQYDHLERGILHFFTDQDEFEAGVKASKMMNQFGLKVDALSAKQCVKLEPALASAESKLAGGTYSASDESGDAKLFTERLAELAAKRGVAFCYHTHVTDLARTNDRITGVMVRDVHGVTRELKADAYTVALGSYSPLLLKPLGVQILVYPAKGYSVTFPVPPGRLAPTISLTDEAFHLVFSRLGERLRIAGTAEFNGYNTELNQARCENILRRALELFPGVGERSDAEFWAGLRPATPNNVPYVGKTKYRNLFLNTGHGTLGWTLACGSGKLLSDIVDGRATEIAP
ncbi:MAG: D-amino acid dehydrogenase [Pseudomonadota bacterium]|nr:D-amino acid dehydrogenase [Pseudomonadota bacterium]